MITRVPSSKHETVRVLALPQRYPFLSGLGDGSEIKAGLENLAEEVLEIRRIWQKQELLESEEASESASQTKQ